MTETNLDFRKQNANVLDEHVLSADDLKKLIEDKFKRAQDYHIALSKREEKLAEFN